MNEREIFIEALQKTDAAARQAYLHQVCGDDVALRQRVEELLKMLEQAGSFLEAPPAAPGTTDAPEAQPSAEEAGSRIGPYKLVQKLGEGGMGAVWVAEQQEPVKRRVALKLIKAGMDSRHVLRRFEQERQALALMDHPHIAKVLDAGSTSGEPGGVSAGRPYFVMELVKGVPITKYCDELHLTLRERLELFVPVCQAIQHAHQKGIVHRDIKPTNVLVCIQDGKPAPKVIDFGVAKALHQQLTEQSLYTEIGQVIGTLEYMSPEQAELSALDIDTRADVYALGVLLYELLTGSTPLRRKRLKDAAVLELLRRIREEEPPKPSTRLSESKESLASMAALRRTEPGRLAKAVRGELDWIVMKALEKDRTRRYETAIGLARDVERHLHDEPVEACPPSAGYRLRKFARRYRTVLATAAAFAALLLIAAGVSIWLAMTARRAESIANDKREEAEEAQQKEAHERNRADREAAQAKANAVETGRALDRITVAKGIELAEKGDLFRALSWFVKPLERGGLTPEEERVHRTRIACYLRHTPGRPVLRQMFFTDGPVSHAAWSADAKRVLTVSGKIVRIWDVRSGESLAALAHPVDVTTAQFTPDGTRVLTASDTIVWQWDSRTGRQLAPPFVDWGAFLQHPLSVLPRTPLQLLANLESQELGDGVWRREQSLEISHDGSRVLFGYRYVLRLVDLASQKPIAQWVSEDVRGWFSDSSHALSFDGQHLLLIRDGQASSHNTADNNPAGKVLEHEGVHAAAFSPDGSRALTFSSNGPIQFWDAKTWKAQNRISHPHLGNFDYVKFSPDNRFIAFGTRDWGPLHLAVWDANSGRLNLSFDEWLRHRAVFDWTPDGRQFLHPFGQGEVELWDVSQTARPAAILPHGSPVTVAVYGPDARMLLTAANDGEVRIWDLSHSNERFAMKPPAADAFDSRMQLDYAIRGHRVLSDDEVTLANAKPYMKRFARVLPLGTRFSHAAVSPDHTRVLTSLYRLEAVVQPQEIPQSQDLQFWDARAKRPLGKPLQTKSCFNCAAFDPTGRFVVVGSGDGALLLEARTGEPTGGVLQHGGSVLYAAFSPDGERLVTCGDDHSARLWQTRTGQPIGERLRHDDKVTLAAFSVDGRTLATASSEGTVHLWDNRGGFLGILTSKSGPVRSLRFHPSGLLLLVYFNDKMRLWDFAARQEISPEMEGRCDLMTGVPHFNDEEAYGEMRNPSFDLPDEHGNTGDLIKLSQLYSGRRLDVKGGTVPLGKEERQALWRELRAKYPAEFTVSSKAAVEWRIRQLRSLIQMKRSDFLAFHRRWLTAELAESGWQPSGRPDEDIEGYRLDWLSDLALHGRHAEATAAADAIALPWSKNANLLYNCACVHALAAGAVKGDAALTDRYATRAVALLRQAIEAGYKDGQHMRKDTDLDALHSRKDFRELLKKLDANKP